MIKKTIIQITLLFFLFSNQFVKSNDISSMAGISETAGNSAQAAADQLASDVGKVAENIASATAALGDAKSDINKALDTSISQVETTMSFVSVFTHPVVVLVTVNVTGNVPAVE